MGRPREKASIAGTQNYPLGKDRLGRDAAKNDDQADFGRLKRSDARGYSLEEAEKMAMRHEEALKGIPTKKQLVFESEKKADNLLDPKQIRE